MAEESIKITELPLSKQVDGLFILAVDESGASVKVQLPAIVAATTAANISTTELKTELHNAYKALDEAVMVLSGFSHFEYNEEDGCLYEVTM